MIKLKYFGLALAAELAFAVAPERSTYAQATATNAPAARAQGGQLEQITVTGYVVPHVGEGAQPVTTLDRDFIERQGDQTVSEVLQRLPQNVAGFTPQVNSGLSFSPAASAVNLGGLGVNSTLVLIDGHRQTAFPFPQNGFQSFTDLNAIPLAAVDRIEVLRDGASAVYGSDAIAGVVNVILKDEYNGADIIGTYGISQRGDYETYHAQLTGGISHNISDTSKFNVIVAFDYFTSSPINTSDRGFSLNTDHALFGPDLTDLRSHSAPAGFFTGRTSGNSFTLIPGTSAPATAGDFTVNGGPNVFNPGERFAQLVPREERYGGYTKVSYSPTQWLQFYDEFSGNHQFEKAKINPTPETSSDNITVPAGNPFNPFGENIQITALRDLEFGPRITETTIDTYRNIAGVRLLNLPKNWFVDASFLYAEADGDSQGINFLSKTRLNQALAGTLPGFVGVFYNPFFDSNGRSPNSPGLINAIKVATDRQVRTDLTEWAVKAGGEIVDLPGGPLTLGLGAEYRSESFVDIKDVFSQTNDVVGEGGTQNQAGKDYDRAAYVEVTIPILGGKCSVPGMRLLEFVASERYDNYSTFGEAWKPKFSLRWKPFEDLTLRASYSEGFRAPSLAELFSANLTAFTPIIDPTPPPGVSNSYEVQIISGGNPHLKPETAYAYYAGFVWSPGSVDPEHSWWGWANGLSVYADWSEILKRNVINTPPTQFVIDNPGLFPGSVQRDAAGLIVNVNNPFQNLGAIRVDSFSFGGNYVTKEFAWGKLNTEVDATYFYHASQQVVPNGQVLNITDSLAPFTPVNPDFKLVASIFYSKTVFGVDTFQTGVTLNYIDSEHDVNDFRALGLTLPDFVNSFGLSQVHTIGSWTTFDWQISYEFGRPAEVVPETPKPGYDKDGKRIVGEKAIASKPEGPNWGWRRWLAGTKVLFGINNIFDTRPPFADLTEGYDTSTSSPIQRFFYVSVEKKF
jgi:iron complex outermembrane recepter protein